MKKCITLVLTGILWLGTVSAQETAVTQPEVLPQFPEGNKQLFSFINEQMTYTDEDRKQAIEGEVIVTFLVDASGRLSEVEIKKGLSPAINAGVVDVISRMPPWRPGRAGGQWVASRYSLAMVIQARHGMAKPLF